MTVGLYTSSARVTLASLEAALEEKEEKEGMGGRVGVVYRGRGEGGILSN